jgi:ribonuclease J
VAVARSSGYRQDLPEILGLDAAATARPETLLIASTGTQGEPQAALARMAEGTHPQIRLEAGDLVVYSSKQIPGNEIAIGRVQNALAARGIEIIGERQAHVHVSGHPGRPELEAMYRWIRPEVAVPVHGERRHMEEHARLARSLGVPQAVVPMNGTVIRLAPGPAAIIDHAPAGRLVLDGDVILPADSATMNSRRKLAWGGLLVVTLVYDARGRLAGDIRVLARGVPVEEEEGDFLAECAEAAESVARQVPLSDRRRLEDDLKIAVRRVARKWTGKKPLTDVQILTL